jgi:hypothetical protein
MPLAAPSILLETLLLNLEKARESCRVDLACMGCGMSADLAFATAYRRLPNSEAVELAKSLAVSVSALLDVHKLPQIVSCGGNKWEEKLNNITDLVQVLFSQTSTEFQYFYEVLLARRLLRCRSISLKKEREVLHLLPAVDKSSLMIR